MGACPVSDFARHSDSSPVSLGQVAERAGWVQQSHPTKRIVTQCEKRWNASFHAEATKACKKCKRGKSKSVFKASPASPIWLQTVAYHSLPFDGDWHFET